MAGEEDEDLLAHFRAQYRQNLPSLLRKFHPTEEDSLPSYIELQKTKKEARQMQKALEEAKEGNDGMRIHALKKARKEREKKMQKESELVRAEENLEALKKQRQQLSNKMQKFSIFKEYLEDVVKVSRFEDIQELIEHFNTLVRMCKDQLQSQHEQKEMSEQGQVLLNQHTAEKGAEIQRLKNELKDLQLRFDQAQKDVLQWDTALADIENKTTKKDLELGTIKMTILNLFQCLSMRLKADLKVSKDDSLKQLDMVELSQSPSPCP
ncbi:coiled-coil domain-containing protein 42 [Phaenicophaeus curvirostris]|uniref:coiled-coil domain-containing protein 42 n=1 Tax=Phaenicophaeus curvirostris TaxID=33595 RepID=UPI0037F09FD8